MFYHSFLNLFWLPAAWTELHVEGAITDSGGETLQGFPGGSVAQNPSASAGDTGDMGLIPGLGRSAGEGNGNPLQHSRLESPMGRGAWWGSSPWGCKESHDWTTEHTGTWDTAVISFARSVNSAWMNEDEDKVEWGLTIHQTWSVNKS